MFRSVKDGKKEDDEDVETGEEIVFHIFKVYSGAPDPLESLNREKVIKITDKSNAKGLRSVLG